MEGVRGCAQQALSRGDPSARPSGLRGLPEGAPANPAPPPARGRKACEEWKLMNRGDTAIPAYTCPEVPVTTGSPSP